MTEARDTMMDRLGRYLAKRLMRTASDHPPFTHPNIEALRHSLEPGDVLLVEGATRVSAAIKYLTQSTWSHSALYVGDFLGQTAPDGEALCLIEVNLGEGCIAVPLSKYECLNTRICRANGLSARDRNRVVGFMVDALGARYDMKSGASSPLGP